MLGLLGANKQINNRYLIRGEILTAVMNKNMVSWFQLSVHEQDKQMTCRQLSRFWHFQHTAFQVCDVIAPTTSAYPSAVVALHYVPKYLLCIYGLKPHILCKFSERARSFLVLLGTINQRGAFLLQP